MGINMHEKVFEKKEDEGPKSRANQDGTTVWRAKAAGNTVITK
jgi:hypothetical protein